MAASTLITVAPTGAEADKAAVPALPVTLDELVGTAKECEAAGAAVIHVHIRDRRPGPRWTGACWPTPWPRCERARTSSSSSPPGAR